MAVHGMVMGHTKSAAAPVRMVTHPSTNWSHDCLISVINHEMLTPSYQGLSSFMIDFSLSSNFWYVPFQVHSVWIDVNFQSVSYTFAVLGENLLK